MISAEEFYKSNERQGFLIDMDGVIYSGGTPIPGAIEFIETLLENDIPFLFLTNNSQFTRRDVVTKLERMGINVEEKHIFTSAMATGRFLAEQKPHGTAYVLGEGGLILSLHNNGYSIVHSDPDYVVVGEGRTLTLEMVSKAIEMILAGARLIATNLDPSPRIPGWNKPGISAVIAMLENATGRKAFSVGKPSPIMMRAARKELGLRTAGTTIIGDTMDTDILGGVQMGYRTILCLSGWSKKDDLGSYTYCPDLIVNSVAEVPIPDNNPTELAAAG